MHIKKSPRSITLTASVLAGLAAIIGYIVLAPAAHGAGTFERVATNGTDHGNCISSPCATINYAISQAVPGATIKVAAGDYNQTVDVSKPVDIVGASAKTTTIDGNGLDPSNNGYYGVVYVGNTGGATTVSGLTITNPYPFSYTGGEPEAVALADPTSADQVNITNDIITEGNADTSQTTDFPIGIDAFANASQTNISNDTISGFFQGALLEDNGPATVNRNTFSNMQTNYDDSTSPATAYPGEGLFFLADGGQTYTDQDATSNTFSGYSGYGIAEDAGYTGGYVDGYPACIANGSITTALTSNSFALTGGQAGDGIFLEVTGPANSLTGQANSNHGSVTAPANAIETQSVNSPPTPQGTDCSPYSSTTGGGGALDITQNNDNITQKAAASGTTAQSAVHRRNGGLHFPHHPRHS